MSLEEARQKYPEFTALNEAIGSVAPMEVLMNMYGKGGQFLLSKSPTAQKYLTGLTNLMASGMAGATYEGLEEVIQGKEISPEDIAKHGATWAALDGFLQTVDWGKNFAKKLMQRSQETGKPSWQVLNNLIEQVEKAGIEVDNVEKLATRAFSDLEKDIEGGAAKISKDVKVPEEVEAIPAKDTGLRPREQEATIDISERKIVPEESIFREEPKGFVADEVTEDIQDFAHRYNDKKEFGENVQGYIEGSRDLNADLWKPGYEEAQPAFKKVLYSAEEPGDLALKTINELDKFKTRGRGYNQAKNDYVNALEDMGFTVKKNRTGGIEDIVHTREYMTAEEAVQLSRRISELGEYEDLERNIRKGFNKLSKTLKEDAKRAVKNYDEKAYKAFENAERQYERFEDKLSRDAIRRIRKTEEAENIAEWIQKPTTLKDLRELLTKDQFHEVERELHSF
jgi:2C-methyl-D-erythritol 2,4-cyclodiphosphate synthase